MSYLPTSVIGWYSEKLVFQAQVLKLCQLGPQECCYDQLCIEIKFSGFSVCLLL